MRSGFSETEIEEMRIRYLVAWFNLSKDLMKNMSTLTIYDAISSCVHFYFSLNVEAKARIALQRSYENNFSSCKIPCFIAFGECGDPNLIR